MPAANRFTRAERGTKNTVDPFAKNMTGNTYPCNKHNHTQSHIISEALLTRPTANTWRAMSTFCESETNQNYLFQRRQARQERTCSLSGKRRKVQSSPRSVAWDQKSTWVDLGLATVKDQARRQSRSTWARGRKIHRLSKVKVAWVLFVEVAWEFFVEVAVLRELTIYHGYLCTRLPSRLLECAASLVACQKAMILRL